VAAEDGLGAPWEVLDSRGGYGSGFVRKCWEVLTGRGTRAMNEKLLRFYAMSQDQLTNLLAKLRDDAGLQEKFKGAADLDVAVAIAKEAGFDVSKADWLRHQAKQVMHLSDEELELVAGGNKLMNVVRIFMNVLLVFSDGFWRTCWTTVLCDCSLIFVCDNDLPWLPWNPCEWKVWYFFNHATNRQNLHLIPGTISPFL
jgi:predicted ribosomally synthesized peptide with nif11-like leader